MEGTPEPVEKVAWHLHAPLHLFRPGAVYFVTAKTLDGIPYLNRPCRRGETVNALKHASSARDWDLVAWVVLPNHYHCLLRAPDAACSLSGLAASAHSFTARRWNRQDAAPGRVVWYQYWDRCITSLGGFLARVNYIHYNPARHGLVSDPADYPFSSYREWLAAERDALAEIERAYPWDRLDLE